MLNKNVKAKLFQNKNESFFFWENQLKMKVKLFKIKLK